MYKAYLDCISGISGDMFAGALIDLGLSKEIINEELAKLPLSGYNISVVAAKKHGISCTGFKVNIVKKQKTRDYGEIKKMLESSSLDDRTRELSLKIFKSLAEAEGKIHNVAPEKVHFHEVGAVDSIIDIVVASLGITRLEISEVMSSRVVTGRGMVRCSHGLMPVPAPATAELLKGMPVEASDTAAELTTPTGAAILKTLCTSHGELPPSVIEKIGYGAGEKDLDERPNILRVFLLKEDAVQQSSYAGSFEQDEMIVMETVIDDMNPQFYEPLSEKLFEAGCADVLLIPLQMKKGRPGIMLQALLRPDLKHASAEIIFEHSTSIGLRYYPVERLKLIRREKRVTTSLGDVTLKILDLGDGRTSIRPEYDDLKKLAKKNNLSIIEAETLVKRELFDIE